jgi:hypothetical protein
MRRRGGIGVPNKASASSAFAVNCLLEASVDAKMKRTSWRASASGEVSPAETIVFAFVLAALGSGILCAWVNVLTMLLTLLTNLSGFFARDFHPHARGAQATFQHIAKRHAWREHAKLFRPFVVFIDQRKRAFAHHLRGCAIGRI